ncbi:MAG: CoA pyrophosphatase [bacterium]|nr:CoA pyrophosphatase [bacterium]
MTSPPKSLDLLARDLDGNLPGSDAQYRMAPDHRAGPEVTAHPPSDARQAAVLILLYPQADNAQAHTDSARTRTSLANDRKATPVNTPTSLHDFHIPMMLRPARSGPHSGQISFPGGAYEKAHDPDLQATALRESEEELAIRPDEVQILGELSQLYVPPSGYLVSPYVGWSAGRPDFVPDPREVDRILEIPLADLLDPTKRLSEEREIQRGLVRVPYFSFREGDDEFKIWGASAMILSELLAVIESLPAM